MVYTGSGNGPVEIKPAADVQGVDAAGNTGVDTYLTVSYGCLRATSTCI
jgi:hypothetical protein